MIWWTFVRTDLLTNQPTNQPTNQLTSWSRSPWEADSGSAGQKSPPPPRNPKFFFPCSFGLSQLSPTIVVLPCSFKIHFNVVPLRWSKSPVDAVLCSEVVSDGEAVNVCVQKCHDRPLGKRTSVYPKVSGQIHNEIYAYNNKPLVEKQHKGLWRQNSLDWLTK
jgi:hypothetical protein